MNRVDQELSHALKMKFGTTHDEPDGYQLENIKEQISLIMSAGKIPTDADWEEAISRHCPSTGSCGYFSIDNSDLNTLLALALQTTNGGQNMTTDLNNFKKELESSCDTFLWNPTESQLEEIAKIITSDPPSDIQKLKPIIRGVCPETQFLIRSNVDNSDLNTLLAIAISITKKSKSEKAPTSSQKTSSPQKTSFQK